MFKLRSFGIALIMILMAIPNFAIFANSRMLRSEAERGSVKEHDVDQEKPKRLTPQPKDSSSSGDRVFTLASGPSRKGGGH